MTARAVVVGGGPAGLMAAEVIAGSGVDVTVFDHARSVGRKLLLAGRGGLNITHGEARDAFVDRYDAPAWIRPILDAFGPDDLRRWCADLGEPTFVGSSGRIFPESFRATPLLRAWLRRLDHAGVVIETQRQWLGWHDGGHRFRREDGSELVVTADVTVLALGGASWPRVGSDGSWVPIVAAAGIDVAPLRASNAGLVVDWSRTFAERFAGSPLKNVALRVSSQGDRERAWVRGDPVITASGLEGGPVYALTRDVRQVLDAGRPCTIDIDLRPDTVVPQLADRLARRRPGDSMSTWLRRSIGLDPVATNLLREATANQMPVDPVALAELVKRCAVTVESIAPIDRAISTAGGVARHELDDALMLVARPGTFVAGEMVDWEAPTGGYLLQACFSTGVVAGRGAVAHLSSP